MKKDLIHKCNVLFMEKASQISPETFSTMLSEDTIDRDSGFVHTHSAQIYIRLIERILLQFTSMVSDEILERLTPLLDENDNDIILQAMGEYVDINALEEKCFQEVRSTYLGDNSPAN